MYDKKVKGLSGPPMLADIIYKQFLGPKDGLQEMTKVLPSTHQNFGQTEITAAPAPFLYRLEGHSVEKFASRVAALGMDLFPELAR